MLLLQKLSEKAAAMLQPHILERAPFVAEALQANQLCGLLAANSMIIRPVHIDEQRLDVANLGDLPRHHLQATADGLSLSQIFNDWRQHDSSATSFPVYSRHRLRLRDKFKAHTAAQLVATAAEAGAIDTSPLELTEPYAFTPLDITVIGLLRQGLESKKIGTVLSLEDDRGRRLSDYTGRLFNDINDRLPADEHAPGQQSGAWLVHTARRLGLYAFELTEAEHLPAHILSRHITTLFREAWPFRASSATSL